MKVWKRILIKLLIFLAAVSVAGAGGIAWKEAGKTTAGYALTQYADHLINNEMDRAFSCLDMGGETIMTADDFFRAAEAKKYGLYAGYHLEKLQNRRDEKGNEFEDYKITFVNSDDEVQAEEEISVKKLAERKFGVFDEWKIVPDHCMVKDFILTVPAGAEVILDGVAADVSWLSDEAGDFSRDQYRIPQILPGEISVTLHHGILEDVVTTVDTMAQSADLCEKMQLGDAGKGECLENSIKVLRELYTAAVKQDTEKLSDLFDSCSGDAKKLVTELQESLGDRAEEGTQFKSIAVSGFNPRYGEIAYSQEDGIRIEINLAYHYLVSYETFESVETGEYDDEGYPIIEEIAHEDSESGDSTAKLIFSYKDETWYLRELEVPVVFSRTDDRQ